MSQCLVRVLEESSIFRCLRVSAATLQSKCWKRLDDYNYKKGPYTIRDALKWFESVIGQYLHACDVQKSPLYEINTERDVGRGREVLRFTGRRSKHASFHQTVYYTDKSSILTDAENAALERGRWELIDENDGMRNYIKKISYRDVNLAYWQIREMGIDDWQKILPNRSWCELAPGFEEYERCPTCSVADAHKFE